MRRETVLLAGLLMIVISMAVGCKKKETAMVRDKNAPVHEQVPVYKFSSTVPSVFPPPPSQALPGGVGNVEWINDAVAASKTKVSRKDRLSIIGWAANDKDGTVPPTVVIQLNSTSGNASYYAVAARTKQKRADIAKAMNNPVFENSAYQLDADVSSVPPGTYLISFLLTDGKYIIGFDSPKILGIE